MLQTKPEELTDFAWYPLNKLQSGGQVVRNLKKGDFAKDRRSRASTWSVWDIFYFVNCLRKFVCLNSDFQPLILLFLTICSQGNGNPMVTSKIFEPMELETAISPWPFLATITDVIRSGTLVPAARKVNPMSAESMLNVSPIRVANQTISQENIEIQVIDIRKEKMNM